MKNPDEVISLVTFDLDSYFHIFGKSLSISKKTTCHILIHGNVS